MAHADKFPGLTTPDDSYHGVTYATDFGPAAYIIKATAQLMRDFGSTPAPINSWIMGMHLESLAVRMERHCANALAVARFLEADPRISWVSYPGLEGDRNHALAAKYMPNGTCGVISFGVPGGRDTRPFPDDLDRHARGGRAQLHALPGRHHPPPAHRGAA